MNTTIAVLRLSYNGTIAALILQYRVVWWVVTQTGAIIFATEERDKG